MDITLHLTDDQVAALAARGLDPMQFVTGIVAEAVAGTSTVLSPHEIALAIEIRDAIKEQRNQALDIAAERLAHLRIALRVVRPDGAVREATPAMAAATPPPDPRVARAAAEQEASEAGEEIAHTEPPLPPEHNVPIGGPPLKQTRPAPGA